jgi:hypothetical protein
MTSNRPYAGPPHPLELVRGQRGWSYEQLARIVACRARELGVANMAMERQKIWRWEHRGVVPDELSRRALARELGVPDELVAAQPWPEWLRPLVAPTPTPTLVEQRRASVLFRSCTPEQAASIAAEHLGALAHAVAAVWETGDQHTVAALLRRMLATTAAYEHQVGALDLADHTEADGVDGVCQMCSHTAVSHGPDGCMVVGCVVGVDLTACPVTDTEFGLTRQESDADEVLDLIARNQSSRPPAAPRAEQSDPLNEADIRCGTCFHSRIPRRGQPSCTCTRTDISIPTVHVDESGILACGCGHPVAGAHTDSGCVDCDCRDSAELLFQARRAPAETDGGQR